MMQIFNSISSSFLLLKPLSWFLFQVHLCHATLYVRQERLVSWWSNPINIETKRNGADIDLFFFVGDRLSADLSHKVRQTPETITLKTTVVKFTNSSIAIVNDRILIFRRMNTS